MRGAAPEAVAYSGGAEPLQRVWIALRTNMRAVLETVTLADLAADALPAESDALSGNQESWVTR